MKTFKNVLLSIMLLLHSISASAYDFEVNGVRYDITSQFYFEVAVTSKEYSYSGVVDIPKEVTYNGDTYSVKGIEYDAFSDCRNLISVTIPNTVTSIGGSAFEGCSNLTSVTIPNSVISIQSSAFDGCSSLTSVIIPSSVKRIEAFTFNGCSKLRDVIIPNSVTYIGPCAFRNCGLRTIAIPNSVKEIESSAFENCYGLSVFFTGISYPERIFHSAFPKNSTLYVIDYQKAISTFKKKRHY